MHKIRTALFVSAAVLLGSCTKPQGEEHGTAIGFSTSTVSQVEGTKSNHTGESTTTETLKNKPFGVYGMYSVTDGGKGTNVFDFSSPVEVRYETNNWTYTFSGSQYHEKEYWKRNMYYRFRAYHPYDATLLQSSSSADGIDIEYRVLDDSYDLLLASATRHTAGGNYDTVQMVFKHALCALKFKIAFKGTVTPSYYTDNIIHFYIKGLNAYGHLSYTGFGEHEAFNWSGTFNSHDKLYEWHGNKEFGVNGAKVNGSKKEPTDILDSNEYFFAIPQTCSDPANGLTSIHLYTRKSGGDNEIDHTVNLPPLKWEAGKIYTYTLLVNKSDIEVSVTIEPWLTKQVPVDIYL